MALWFTRNYLWMILLHIAKAKSGISSASISQRGLYYSNGFALSKPVYGGHCVMDLPRDRHSAAVVANERVYRRDLRKVIGNVECETHAAWGMSLDGLRYCCS